MAKIDEGACSLFYQYQIRDKNGKIKRNSRRYRAHSFVKGFLASIYQKMGYTNVAIVTTGDITKTQYFAAGMQFSATAGNSWNNYSSGIQVGTGSNAVSIDDTKLQTQIGAGTGVGQLNYGTCAVASPSSTTTITQTIISRQFSNSSGGSITINEVGLASYTSYYETIYVLCVRDTVSIPLSNGDQLTFNYIIQTTI